MQAKGAWWVWKPFHLPLRAQTLFAPFSSLYRWASTLKSFLLLQSRSWVKRQTHFWFIPMAYGMGWGESKKYTFNRYLFFFFPPWKVFLEGYSLRKTALRGSFYPESYIVALHISDSHFQLLCKEELGLRFGGNNLRGCNNSWGYLEPEKLLLS